MLEAGVCDDRVETAVEAVERGVDGRAVALARRQVAVLEIDRVHVPAVGGEPLGDRRADTPRRAGDQDVHR